MIPDTILKGCIAGIASYQKQIYEQFYGYALRIALRYIHQQDEAIVVVNDSFAEFLFDVDSLKFQSGCDIELTVKSKVKKIIVYKAIDKLFNSLVRSDPTHNYTKNISFDLSNKDSDNFYGQLMSLLGSLPLWHRVLFNMHVIDGFSLFEIANHFGTSVSTCVADLAQAKSFLKKSMANKENFPQSVDQTMPIAN